MHSFTSCCAHNGARQGITPYQRLRRSRSASSHPDILRDCHSHRFLGNDSEPDKHKLAEHDLSRDKSCSASCRINLHSNADLSRTGSIGEATTVSGTSPSSSQQSKVKSVPRHIGNAENFVNMLNASRTPGGRSLVELGSEDVNTVLLKIAIIGDSGTGKTSFMAKYGGVELKKDARDIAFLRKLCTLQHVDIALHIWDLGDEGQWQYSTKMPLICKDAATIFIMFDLTRRSTLQRWYIAARELNRAAMIVLVGTKYDGFVQLSKEYQLAIIQEASNHSKKMKALLFFSSAAYNINVHKAFKVVVAKLFDLPCGITKSFNLGEPVVSY